MEKENKGINSRLMESGKLRKVAITGPESTGKSILAEQLANYYQTCWVPEFAREYLDRHGPAYDEKDILLIAKGQLLKEKEAEKQANGYLFCDTEFIVTKIWSEVRYKRCDPWILLMIDQHQYDLYLLCDIGLPWEPDPLREHPQMREKLFDMYHNELISGNLPYAIIRGLGKERLGNAVRLIEEHFNKSK